MRIGESCFQELEPRFPRLFPSRGAKKVRGSSFPPRGGRTFLTSYRSPFSAFYRSSFVRVRISSPPFGFLIREERGKWRPCRRNGAAVGILKEDDKKDLAAASAYSANNGQVKQREKLGENFFPPRLFVRRLLIIIFSRRLCSANAFPFLPRQQDRDPSSLLVETFLNGICIHLLGPLPFSPSAYIFLGLCACFFVP